MPRVCGNFVQDIKIKTELKFASGEGTSISDQMPQLQADMMRIHEIDQWWNDLVWATGIHLSPFQKGTFCNIAEMHLSLAVLFPDCPPSPFNSHLMTVNGCNSYWQYKNSCWFEPSDALLQTRARQKTQSIAPPSWSRPLKKWISSANTLLKQ